MATLTVLNNPFNILDRTIKEVGHGVAIFYYLNTEKEGVEFVVSLNGQITEDYTQILQANDSLAFVAIPKGGGGGGSNPLRTIVMLALVVMAPQIAGGIMGATAGSVSAGLYGGLSGSLIFNGLKMATVLVGGLIVNAILPPASPSLPNNSGDLQSVSPTYSWSGSSNVKEAGTALPVMLGSARVVPPVIGSYISLKDDKQYLNILLAVNDGEVDDITDIEINSQPISNYNDITYEITKGTASQSAIGNFRDSETTVSLQRSLNEQNAVTAYTTAGNAVQELEVVMIFAKGLFHANDDGSYVSRSVTFEISYRKAGDAEWIVFDTPTVSATYKTTKRLAYPIKNLSPAQYEVQITRTSTYSTSTRDANDLALDYINEIVYDDFLYPGVALLSINAMATDQLNGSFPLVTCKCTNTGATYPKSNPAWACYDLLKRAGINDSDIDMTAFSEWAAYCDSKNLKAGLYLDTQQELQTALNMVSTLGRATVVQFGSKFAPIVDKEVDIPTQSFLFTSGNIINNSFSLSYIPFTDRSNTIEVTYYDEEDSYKAKTVQLQSHDFDTTTIEQKASINLYGCTNRQQAADYAQYLLNNNRYLTETVSFKADIDSIACTVGDVIKVGKRYMTNTTADGRIAEATDSYIKLDQEVFFKANIPYEIQYRLQTDEIVTLDIPAYSEDTTTDTINITVSQIPQKFDVFALGEQTATAVNLYRVTDITRSGDFSRNIKALEYNPSVYNDSAVINVEEVIPLDEIRNLEAYETMLKNQDGSIDEILTLTWSGHQESISLLKTSVYVNGVKYGETENTFFEFKNTLIAGQTYTFKVGDKEITHKFLGQSEPPPPPDNFYVDYRSGNDVKLSWKLTDKPVDFKGYALRVGNTRDWVLSVPIAETSSENITLKLPNNTKTILLKSVDLKGNLSIETRTIELDFGDTIISNLVYTRIADFLNDTNIGFIETNGVYETVDAGAMYVAQDSDIFYGETDTAQFYDPLYGEAYIISRFTPDTAGSIVPQFDGIGSPAYFIRGYFTSQFYDSLDGLMYDDVSVDMYDEDSWSPFVDYDTKAYETYEIKADFLPAKDKSTVNEIRYLIDAPDILDFFDDVSISSSGTYVLPTKPMNALKNVSVTLQDDGGDAVSARVISKDTTNGAFIKLYDINQATTEGVVDITMKGY